MRRSGKVGGPAFNQKVKYSTFVVSSDALALLVFANVETTQRFADGPSMNLVHKCLKRVLTVKKKHGSS